MREEYDFVPSPPSTVALTDRQREVLVAYLHSANETEAGVQVGLTRRTVKMHLDAICKKLGAKNHRDLLRVGIVTGLIRLEVS